jgi:hypothetical protein
MTMALFSCEKRDFSYNANLLLAWFICFEILIISNYLCTSGVLTANMLLRIKRRFAKMNGESSSSLGYKQTFNFI